MFSMKSWDVLRKKKEKEKDKEVFEAEKKTIEVEKKKDKEVFEAEKKTIEVEKKKDKEVFEAEKSELKTKLSSKNAEILRSRGLFSARGMLEFIEGEKRDEYEKIEREKNVNFKYTRQGLFKYLASYYGELAVHSEMSQSKFAKTLSDAYKNLSKGIHDGKKSAKQVQDSGDEIIIHETELLTYDQVICLRAFALVFDYPHKVILRSGKDDVDQI